MLTYLQIYLNPGFNQCLPTQLTIELFFPKVIKRIILNRVHFTTNSTVLLEKGDMMEEKQIKDTMPNVQYTFETTVVYLYQYHQ